MTETTPTDLSATTLSKAAALLRDLAEGATPGPWVMTRPASTYGALVSVGAPADADEWAGYRGALICESIKQGNRRYIETFPPEVGLALADLLDKFAAGHPDPNDWIDQSALILARRIIGEAGRE